MQLALFTQAIRTIYAKYLQQKAYNNTFDTKIII